MSDNDGKVKVYKNRNRNLQTNYKPYVPQWQIDDRGIEPTMYQGAIVPSNVKIAGPSALPSDNPRAKRAPLRQPYAPVSTASPVGRGKGPVPNVGNNMEHTWSAVDSNEIVDDLTGEIDPNQAMTDNNDYVSDQAMVFQSGFTATDIQPNVKNGTVQFEQESYEDSQPISGDTGDLLSIVSDLEENTLLLIVSGVPVCSGPKELIEEQAHLMASGEHEMCDGNPVSLDDIVILKRVKVKVGLFLE